MNFAECSYGEVPQIKVLRSPDPGSWIESVVGMGLSGSGPSTERRAMAKKKPNRSVSIPSLIAVVVTAVLVGLLLVLVMPVE
jgi:hypothetical protein